VENKGFNGLQSLLKGVRGLTAYEVLIFMRQGFLPLFGFS
jgi:hypothetical protein